MEDLAGLDGGGWWLAGDIERWGRVGKTRTWDHRVQRYIPEKDLEGYSTSTPMLAISISQWSVTRPIFHPTATACMMKIQSQASGTATPNPFLLFFFFIRATDGG